MSLRLNSISLKNFFGLGVAISSIFIWPNLGDTIREPKWVWLWGFALTFSPIWLAQVRNFPKLLFLPLLYFLCQPLVYAPFNLTFFFQFSFLATIALGLASTHPKLSAKLDRWIMFAVSLQLIVGILQIFKIDPIFEPFGDVKNPNPFVGFFGQTTLLGAYLSAVSWYFGGRKNWLFFALSSVGTIVTGSAFSIFAWIAGLAAWLIWHKKYSLFLCQIFTMAAFIFIFRDHSFFSPEGRWIVWRMALSAWLERFWFGWGMDSFAREFHAYHQGNRDRPWLQAHNEPIELLFSGGIVGLLFALMVLGYLMFKNKLWWRKSEKLPWFLLLICISANSLGNFPLHLAPIALLTSLAFFQLLKENREGITTS